MDPSGKLDRLGDNDAQIDQSRLIGGVQEVFDTKGGIDGLVSSLRAGGLGNEVDSWVSTGANEPVAPQQLGRALGADTVNELSAKTGLSIESLLPLLATFLPMIINHFTPKGQVPEAGTADNQPDIGDLLGGILGGGGLGGMLGGGR